MPCTSMIKSKSNSVPLLWGHFSPFPKHDQQPLVEALLPVLEIDLWQYLTIFANICNKIRSSYFWNSVRNGIQDTLLSLHDPTTALCGTLTGVIMQTAQLLYITEFELRVFPVHISETGYCTLIVSLKCYCTCYYAKRHYPFYTPKICGLQLK